MKDKIKNFFRKIKMKVTDPMWWAELVAKLLTWAIFMGAGYIAGKIAMFMDITDGRMVFEDDYWELKPERKDGKLYFTLHKKD